MPTIAWFYGIMIQMFYNDHDPPHFHARYGRARAVVRLSDGEVISRASCRRLQAVWCGNGLWRGKANCRIIGNVRAITSRWKK
jgi:hypothetical protein